MNAVMSFYLEMLIVSAVFFCGYRIIHNHTTPAFKRFYLIGWLVFSLVFPSISIELQSAPTISVGSLLEESHVPSAGVYVPENLTDEDAIEGEINQPHGTELAQSDAFDWYFIGSIVYGLVSLFFLLRVVMAFFQILKMKKNSQRIFFGDRTIYEVSNVTIKGASFFNWIFIEKDINEAGRLTVINHELVHSRLIHSADILISHLYCCICWVNPFAWILKQEIGVNCELEADAYLIQTEDKSCYANLLLDMSLGQMKTPIVNHFSTFHLKARIKAISNPSKHKTWVPVLFAIIMIATFTFVSCGEIETSEMGRIERLNDVKTITTRFTSHQSDTQQKTGKIVALASFLPDGTLDEFVEQTTYPYDNEYEVEKSFWEQPDKAMIPYIMDGLTLGTAEKSFLYGSDWPAAYARNLIVKSEGEKGDFPWKEIVEVDNKILPGRIDRKKEREPFKERMFVDFMMPDIIEYFDYDNGKIKEVSLEHIYREVEYDDEERKKLLGVVKSNRSEEADDFFKRMKESSGKKELKEQYTYDDDLLTSLKTGEYEYRFYYEKNLLVKSEYYKQGRLLNTRFHYYENNLKERTEIFNIYNELEYTINYEYEFWE